MSDVQEPINIQVAKRLGYTVYHYDKDYPDKCYYMLMTPTFNPVILGREGERKTEAMAWADAPLWDNDLNSAIQLIKGTSFTLRVTRENWHVELESPDEKVTRFSGDIGQSDEIPGVIIAWWLANVDPKAEQRKRKIADIQQKIADLQDELHDIEGEEL